MTRRRDGKLGRDPLEWMNKKTQNEEKPVSNEFSGIRVHENLYSPTEMISCLGQIHPTIILLDQDFKVIVASDRVADFAQIGNADEMRGQSIVEVLPFWRLSYQDLCSTMALGEMFEFDFAEMQAGSPVLTQAQMVRHENPQYGVEFVLWWNRRINTDLSTSPWQQAVHQLDAALMMCDADFKITFVNHKAMDLFSKREMSFRRLIPGFSAESMIGRYIDEFYQKPEHARAILTNPQALPYQSSIQVDDLTFSLMAAFIEDQHGNHIGNSVIWKDITPDIRARQEIIALMDRAAEGSWDMRFEAEGYEGFHRDFAIAINQLLDNITGPLIGGTLEKMAHQAHQLSLGQHFAPITGNYQGDFSVLQQSLNQLGALLQRFYEVWQETSEHHKAGEIDFRPQIEDFPGYFRMLLEQISEVLNQHITLTTTVVDVVGRYAHGDFKPDIPRYPNQLAGITEAVQHMKLSLQTMSNEVLALLSQANSGKLDIWGNASAFEGKFRDIIEGVNTMLHQIISPVRDVTKILSAVAQGDLSASLSVEYPGDLAELERAVESCIANLVVIVNQLHTSAGQLIETSSNINQGYQDLQERSEQQSATLEETASSVDMFADSVNLGADRARNTQGMTEKVVEQVHQGLGVLGAAVKSMQEMSDASQHIGELVGVIDGIAFQTNILALNASVEAAHAGEYGRGFAVVATEVRNLSKQSTDSARHIKRLVQDAQNKIREGGKFVQSASETMSGIETSMRELNGFVHNITSSIEDQSLTISQINRSLSDLLRFTQENTSLVEQTSAAGKELVQQGENLNHLVSFFQLPFEEVEKSAVKWSRDEKDDWMKKY